MLSEVVFGIDRSNSIRHGILTIKIPGESQPFYLAAIATADTVTPETLMTYLNEQIVEAGAQSARVRIYGQLSRGQAVNPTTGEPTTLAWLESPLAVKFRIVGPDGEIVRELDLPHVFAFYVRDVDLFLKRDDMRRRMVPKK